MANVAPLLATLSQTAAAADPGIPSALIGAMSAVAVALISTLTLVLRRGNAERSRPDDSYRRLVRRVGVFELFLGLRGYDTSKIRTGRETDEATRTN